jgi:hypothetical protein
MREKKRKSGRKKKSTGIITTGNVRMVWAADASVIPILWMWKARKGAVLWSGSRLQADGVRRD